MEHMVAATAIKTEPECWMMGDDEYVTAGDLYRNETGTITYTEYEIRPFDYRFDYEPADLDYVGDCVNGGVGGGAGFICKVIVFCWLISF